MARWVIADADAASEEESEVEDLEDEEPVEDANAADQAGDEVPTTSSRPAKAPLKIKLGQTADVCHVCGQRGHMAGFVGAKYIDCPSKPCYLCGVHGHSTMTCPHRVSPGHGCTQASEVSSDNLLTTLQKRERGSRLRPLPLPSRRWEISEAVLKLHSRRVTCLEFHPSHNSLVLSGDKKGQVAVWNLDKVYERTVYTCINRWQTNSLRFMPGGDGSACATASYDGTVKLFDMETGTVSRVLYDANPQGWDGAGDEEPEHWVTMIGMDVMAQAGVVVAGDSIGNLHVLDPRMSQPVASLQIHKKGTKVQSVHSNPVDGNLLMTAGNDYMVRLLDLRTLVAGASSADNKGKSPAGKAAAAHPSELACLKHPRVINSAYFSPVTGRKILTTCQDNRIRVWDYVYRTHQEADREIVHSQNFNRYLTPFKAEFDPKDPAERLVVCGRYISEDYGGVALHPVDLLDAATGALTGELTDPNLTTISPVNKPHPRREILVSGSSRSLYAWRPAEPEEEEEGEEGEREQKRRRSGSSGRWGGFGDMDASGGLPFGLQGSGNFVFFDADEGEGDGKKKRKAGGTSTKAATKKSESPATKAKPAGKAKASPAAGAKAKSQVASKAAPKKGKEGEDGSSSDSE